MTPAPEPGAPRDTTWRVVSGALRAAINDHGPITKEHVPSATKRIVGQIEAAAKLVQYVIGAKLGDPSASAPSGTTPVLADTCLIRGHCDFHGVDHGWRADPEASATGAGTDVETLARRFCKIAPHQTIRVMPGFGPIPTTKTIERQHSWDETSEEGHALYRALAAEALRAARGPSLEQMKERLDGTLLYDAAKREVMHALAPLWPTVPDTPPPGEPK